MLHHNNVREVSAEPFVIIAGEVILLDDLLTRTNIIFALVLIHISGGEEKSCRFIELEELVAAHSYGIEALFEQDAKEKAIMATKMV